MLQVDLDDEGMKILRAVLESDLAELSMEIADSDRLDFRDMLRQRRQVLKKVLAACGDDAAS